MKCPACETEMKQVMAGDIALDICSEGCGGMWFDAGELDKFDDGEEFDPQTLVTMHISKTVDQKQIRKCPHCADEVLARQFYDAQNKVEMNQCWNCSGIFLDRGELSILKSEYKNDAEHLAAVNNYAENCVSEQIKEMNAEGAAWKQEYETTHASRFLASVNMLKAIVGFDTESQ